AEPEMTVSIVPALKSQAANAMTPTRRAMQTASARKRDGSPFASPPSDAPSSSDMADVTVIAVCLELQNSQKTSPEKRQAYRPASGGRLASEASASPAGMR